MKNTIIEHLALSKKSNAVEQIRYKEKISYALGDLGSCLIWNTVGSFLLYFYTDVASIPAQIAGTLIFLARIIDAVIDPSIGALVDRTTSSKYGKTRGYILFGALPLCIFAVLTFTTFDSTMTIKVAWAFFTYLILGVLFSVVNIPYGSLMALITADSKQKIQLASFRNIGMATGSIFLAASTMPLVSYLGKGNEKLGFQLVMIIFSLIALISFMMVYLNCKERMVSFVKKEKVSLKDIFKDATRNVPWLVTVLFSFITFVRIGLIVGITIYYCLYVLNKPQMASVLLPLLFVCGMIGSFLAPKFLGIFKHRKGTVIALIISTVTYALMYFVKDNMYAFFLMYIISHSSFCLILTNAMISDTSSYHEWRFGQHAEGTLYAGYSFVTKVGVAFGGAVIGYILAFSGFEPSSAITPEISNVISLTYFISPVVLNVLLCVVIFFYRLDHLMPRIVDDLSKHKTFGESENSQRFSADSVTSI
ncbi:MFS transporter [Klebsiella pneumoniae]|uniref:MFS transporter n=1 Tax=Klebsiella pneumoniae TaxID=573 RepID=UPI001ABCD249|nr:glycoside-pentoside-hexuronide (GPH):cation symporter [Klebsiella pneumoniae]MBO3721284.1 MFS transporter [Klebsiella pneumoniae]HCM5830594.1 MFS transporter [Klebsiella pneumoniae]